MEKNYCCPRCGNRDEKYFGVLNGQLYCRKCITFKGEEVAYFPSQRKSVTVQLQFKLSKKQIEISNKVTENYFNGINTLIYAVTGAGKTEIIYDVMSKVLSRGLKVGLAIPRKDVVIELYPRIKNAFKGVRVIKVYGGHSDVLKGDIILLTTHQLYRYKNYFDLLIVDEIDAFPYQNNEILEAFFLNSLRSNYVLMSATPSDEVKELFKRDGHQILTLFSRFHKFPLPVPKVIIALNILQVIIVIMRVRRYIEQSKQVLIFVPTINDAKKYYAIFHLFFKKMDYVHSKRINKEQIVENFKNKKLRFLITTSILERGVTIENLQVIIMHADHTLFSSQALIQISGRVGRSIKYPEGDVIFIARRKTDEIKRAIEEIKECNANM